MLGGHGRLARPPLAEALGGTEGEPARYPALLVALLFRPLPRQHSLLALRLAVLIVSVVCCHCRMVFAVNANGRAAETQANVAGAAKSRCFLEDARCTRSSSRVQSQHAPRPKVM